MHTHGEPAGTIETVHGVRTYIAGGSDPERSKSTIIYLPDAFSLKLVNNKLLADKYASSTGCRVLIPDVVLNGGMPPSVLDKMEYLMEPLPGGWWDVGGMLVKIGTVISVLPLAVPFLLFGHPKNAYPGILAYARAVRAELPAGGKLGVAGFCWGAWSSTKLCTETATAATTEGGSGTRLIDAQFNGHPSYIIETPTMVVDAIKTFKVPYAAAIAEKDFQFNADEAAKCEAQVREATTTTEGDGYVYEFRIYKGAKHGFCVKSKEDDMQGYHDAVKQATEWFNKYLN